MPSPPLLRALEEHERYDISSLVSMISSGVMWSMEVKQASKHNENLVLTDSFGASGRRLDASTRRRMARCKRIHAWGHCKVYGRF